MIELEYITKLKQVIEKISVEQSDQIRAAADICAEVINSGKLVHLFGSGHSVLPVWRCGRLAPSYGSTPDVE